MVGNSGMLATHYCVLMPKNIRNKQKRLINNEKAKQNQNQNKMN